MQMPADQPQPRPQPAPAPREARDRKRRREDFLADLAEAQRLRERVAPRRARMARLRKQQLLRTFFY
ncbi:hypothetical protein KGQ20_04360 [Catenulispora sp. NF23]|uniref:Uncharacterized protein n=1 Tax=Catenulispora pinistramenti TaxID=2705254 RepID=A0ABS5L0F7_9ACTN|nr:hypothetical protein [Catenulispora pinistramenti]MBS2531996.1 hypothetical protein [Catenulispora pinistramenti]MBS2551808.1 hypothetical protein [Catenulispora pinistramenti]